MTTMTGSEKQVAWADDMRTEFIRDMNHEEYGFLTKVRRLAATLATDKPDTNWTAIVAEIEGWYAEALATSDARAWIEGRGSKVGLLATVAQRHGVKIASDNPFTLMQRMATR